MKFIISHLNRQPYPAYLPVYKRPHTILLVLLFFTLLGTGVSAQQEPQFTKYMFNTLSYNPGYAGSRGYMSAVALYRDQWFGWGSGNEYDGRPVTQTFSLHSPVNKQVGLGFNIVNDRIGARKTTYFNAIYAYRIGFGEGTLSIGLQAGLFNWRADWDELIFKDARELDNAFDGPNPGEVMPDFGAGVYFYTERFYAGASLPHMAQFSLRDLAPEEKDVLRKWARSYRHFYLTAGGAIPLGSERMVFKPSILVKSVGFFPEFFKQGNLVREIGAPSTFDIDLSLLFHKKVWLGASFRSAFAAIVEQQDKTSSHDSVDFWTSLLFKNGFRLGFAYDYPLNQLSNYSSGSFELMLGFDFFREVEKVNSPRYF